MMMILGSPQSAPDADYDPLELLALAEQPGYMDVPPIQDPALLTASHGQLVGLIINDLGTLEQSVDLSGRLLAHNMEEARKVRFYVFGIVSERAIE